MDLISRISENFSESAHLKLQCMDTLAAPIAVAAQRMVDCLKADGKILSCGNGGSAADAQHFSSELLNRFEKERPGLAAMTFFELPLVEIASSMSSAWPSARTCLANTCE